MKKLLIAVVVIIAVIAVAAFLLVSNIDSLIGKLIEKQGGEVTRTSVRVSGVDISLSEGRGSIEGLEIANPDGFAARTAFSLADITIDLDIKSLRENPLVINEVHIRAPVVCAEITKTGDSNIDELRKRVQNYTAARRGGSGESDKEAKRIRIERFVFEKGNIEIDASALGLEKRTIEFPEFRLDDVGGANGAPAGEIARIVLTTVAVKTTSEIAGSEIDRLVKEKLGGSALDKAKDLLKRIGH